MRRKCLHRYPSLCPVMSVTTTQCALLPCSAIVFPLDSLRRNDEMRSDAHSERMAMLACM